MLLIKKSYITLLIIFSSLIAQDINGKVVFAYTDKEEAESFALKRVYLTFSKVISEELSVTIQTDVDPASSPQDIYLSAVLRKPLWLLHRKQYCSYEPYAQFVQL